MVEGSPNECLGNLCIQCGAWSDHIPVGILVADHESAQLSRFIFVNPDLPVAGNVVKKKCVVFLAADGLEFEFKVSQTSGLRGRRPREEGELARCRE